MKAPRKSESLTEVTLAQLVALVKAAQKEKLRGRSGTWLEFLKARSQTGGTDPARQSKEVLEAYAADLLLGPAEGGSAEQRAEQGAAREFTRRFLKWARRVRKDDAKGRGVIPEAEASTSGQQQPQPQQQQGEQGAQQRQQQQVSVWSLVRRTRAHGKYGACYGGLPSYMPGWERSKRPDEILHFQVHTVAGGIVLRSLTL
ncbi:hypothetical protein TSOC_003021 [Tetrabaena socialis]|uniref:Uncharacterized protein n=1 Tax=Tetrabaena socialis TaxID=47790 RepID=A0A2J8ACQ1_9CHLO|nr:hypothetical protein TSOC_003021 [Tetrabaena socialis]|eukprot:PNH10287.1 hypothetical protein TSOC_003021 [Tetrabaena socialis]